MRVSLKLALFVKRVLWSVGVLTFAVADDHVLVNQQYDDCFLQGHPSSALNNKHFLDGQFAVEYLQKPAKLLTFAARERFLQHQSRVLERALAKIAPGKPNVPELFVVGFAGDASQAVFMREVMAVEHQFAKQFQTAQHQIMLINHLSTLNTYPIASVHGLKRALFVIGQRMNPEDVLFLFMTSHGSREHQFYLNLGNYQFEILDPNVLKKMLDDAQIKNRVLAISACYSGGFIPALADKYSLIMTASRADRSSFGCSNENEWTYFGHAFFETGLKKTKSFIRAFEWAKVEVNVKEKEQKEKPSEPQISIGSEIPAILKAFE